MERSQNWHELWHYLIELFRESKFSKAEGNTDKFLINC